MDLMATGCIHAAFGLDGFVKVESYSGEYEHFLKLNRVFVQLPKTRLKALHKLAYWLDIEEVRLRVTDALFKFRTINTVEDAKKLSGSILFVERGMAVPLGYGEFYVYDLCNCVLFNGNEAIGKITSIVEGGGGYLLEVLKTSAQKKVYIPFNKEFIGRIDIVDCKVELLNSWIIE